MVRNRNRRPFSLLASCLHKYRSSGLVKSSRGCVNRSVNPLPLSSQIPTYAFRSRAESRNSERRRVVYVVAVSVSFTLLCPQNDKDGPTSSAKSPATLSELLSGAPSSNSCRFLPPDMALKRQTDVSSYTNCAVNGRWRRLKGPRPLPDPFAS